MGFVGRQKESPFDHLSSLLLKPYYKLKCPKITNKNGNLSNCALPKIFIISARPEKEKRQAQSSWKKGQINVIDTKEISNLITDHSICRKESWSNRLFSIYQRVFRDVLNKYTEDEDFIFVEDDVFLLDHKSLRRETCMAREAHLQFYSFYRPASQQSCLYHHGTPCFYVQRQFVEHLAKSVPVREFCRLPIDMYIASIGPWYSTTKMIVQHNTTKRFNVFKCK